MARTRTYVCTRRNRDIERWTKTAKLRKEKERERARPDDGQRVRVMERREKRRAVNCEKEREEGRKKKESERIRYIEIEGKREREREGHTRHTGRDAARRGASPRVTQSSGHGSARRLVERGGSQFSTAFLRGSRSERARFTVSRRAQLYSSRSLSRLYVVRFFSFCFSPSLPLCFSLSLFLLDQTAESDRQMNAVIRATG